jgi:hypothetical protein
VFVGPIAGWNGPVLGPRLTAAAVTLPADAKAYAGDKPDAIQAATLPGAANAPQALEGSVRTPPPEGKRHAKRIQRGPAVKEDSNSALKAKSAEAKLSKTTEPPKGHPVKPPPKPTSDQ